MVTLITVHDGFTLANLVSYDGKHNQANGENNRDGTSDNYSWNCGAEGPTSDPDILALRARQSRALLTTLMLSFGVIAFRRAHPVFRRRRFLAGAEASELQWFTPARQARSG